MDNYELDSNNNLKKIYSHDKLLDILIEFERILDSWDLYAFDNWLDAEIVSGPHFSRYWIEIVLKYDRDKKPDVDGAKRLIKQGMKVKYKKATETVPVSLDGHDDQNKYDRGKRKTKKKEIWLIYIKMPRHLITDIDAGHLETDDEIIDLDDVRSAEEIGVDQDNLASEEDLDDEM